jgi:hypothetical protein
MKKVICIHGIKLGHNGLDEIKGKIIVTPADQSKVIYEGEVYTVTKETVYFNTKVYKLKERRKEDYYAASFFLPLSDIDETELIKERQLQTT